MLKFFENKAFDGFSQIYVIGDKSDGRGLRVAEARRRTVRYGDDFDFVGGHSANLEAL